MKYMLQRLCRCIKKEHLVYLCRTSWAALRGDVTGAIRINIMKSEDYLEAVDFISSLRDIEHDFHDDEYYNGYEKFAIAQFCIRVEDYFSRMVWGVDLPTFIDSADNIMKIGSDAIYLMHRREGFASIASENLHEPVPHHSKIIEKIESIKMKFYGLVKMIQNLTGNQNNDGGNEDKVTLEFMQNHFAAVLSDYNAMIDTREYAFLYQQQYAAKRCLNWLTQF